MNPEIFSEWMRKQGHHVIRTNSSYWYNQGPRVYQAFPYHWVITIPEEELSDFVRNNKIVGLRYSTPLEASEGCLSYHAIYEKEEGAYSLEALGKWSRKNIRRGLKNCVVEPISFDKLAIDGWALQNDTLQRQGRNLNLTQGAWEKKCLLAKNLQGFTAWGAFVNGKLAASVITFQMNDWMYMLYQQCQREYLSLHVNNALSYTVTSAVLKQEGINSVLYGLHSLDAPSSVDEFKFRMGYKAKMVRQRVYFNSILANGVKTTTHTMLQKLQHRYPHNPTLAKAEGMVRFYLQGKLPLEQQPYPFSFEEKVTERNLLES